MLSTIQKPLAIETKVATGLKIYGENLLGTPSVVKLDRFALAGPIELDDLVLVPDVTW
jgi:hypothetical protein